jgi:ABC-type polysaccharide/polyol phosphate export permease
VNVRSESDQAQRRYSDVVHVFEPNSLDLPSLPEYVSELVARRTFIIELAEAEIRGQRSSTFLGELWALADPVFQAAIYMFLYTVIRGPSAGSSTQYVTTIVGSVFLFNYTRIAISDGGRSILRHKGLVLNSIFPRALLTISDVYKGFLLTMPALAVYLTLHLAVRAPITQAVLLLPLLLFIQTVMNLGLALLFSTATVYFKDMSNFLNYIVRLLTFATPVVYPVAMLSPSIKRLLSWNPLFPLFSAYQAIITGHMPAPWLIFQSVVWAIVLIVSGVWVFLRYERSFALHI